MSSTTTATATASSGLACASASDAADAASGLLALVNATAGAMPSPASAPVLRDVAVQRSSIIVSDISDDDGHDESGNNSDAESSLAASSPASANTTATSASTTIPKRRGRPVGSASFPIALMTVLKNSGSSSNSHGASFEPDGHTFTIHDARTFSDPKTGPLKNQLRINSFKTFLRKLEQWGFVRLQVPAAGPASTNTGNDAYTFYHPSGRFVRSEPNMARTIRRASRVAVDRQQAHATSAKSATARTSLLAPPASTPVAGPTTATTASSPQAYAPMSASHERASSMHSSPLTSYQQQILLLEQRRIQLHLRMQRMAALDRSIRGGVRYSDVQVGAATRNVVGAAMMALQRDRVLHM